eukprot:3631164-Rhodomonas_salina.5
MSGTDGTDGAASRSVQAGGHRNDHMGDCDDGRRGSGLMRGHERGTASPNCGNQMQKENVVSEPNMAGSLCIPSQFSPSVASTHRPESFLI